MNTHDILINILAVGSFAFLSAQLVNYSHDSAERSRFRKKEVLRKLHIAALKGCKSASEKWDRLRSDEHLK